MSMNPCLERMEAELELTPPPAGVPVAMDEEVPYQPLYHTVFMGQNGMNAQAQALNSLANLECLRRKLEECEQPGPVIAWVQSVLAQVSIRGVVTFDNCDALPLDISGGEVLLAILKEAQLQGIQMGGGITKILQSLSHGIPH